MSSRKKRVANSGPGGQDSKLSPVRKRGKGKKTQSSQPETQNDDIVIDNVNMYNHLSEDSEDEIILNKPKEVEVDVLSPSKATEQPNLKKRTKVITIENVSVEAVKAFITPIQLQESYQLLKKRDNMIQLQCNSNEDKKKVINKLKEQQLSFYTYSENDVKTQIYVLKRHHYVTPEELLTSLKSHNIPASKVSLLKNDKTDPIFLVHFIKDVVNFFTLSAQHSIIDNLVIKWEKFKKSAKKLTQCYNCQQYGHSSTNCGKQFKCVKCIDNHEPGQCSRKTREGSPQCCNCKMFHAANSKLCTFFLNYKEKVNSFKKAPMPRAFNSTLAPWASPINSQENCLKNTQSNFPELSSKVSMLNNENYQKNLTGNNINNNNFNKFANDQKEFAEIPEIGKTLELFGKLVNELKSTSDHGARLAIMMQYCSPYNVC